MSEDKTAEKTAAAVTGSPPAEQTAAVTAPVELEKPENVEKVEDWQAQAEKWKAMSRKHESNAKANLDKARRFDELEEASKTELQKAQDASQRYEKELGELRLQAIRAVVAANKNVPIELLFGSSEEEFNSSADQLIAFRGAAKKPDFGSGQRGTDIETKVDQITSRDSIKTMTPQDIVKAKSEGRFEELLGNKH